jgi:hypothetical protein
MPVLVVQQGHCYRKTGATGTTGEQAYATAVADACVTLLHGRGGWTVNTTLADENDYHGAAFVAIHCDGSTSPAARGASVGYRTPEGQVLGQAWKRAYAARGWTGGFRPDNYTTALAQYYGTGNAVAVGNRRAFIAECGFRTNTEDRELLDEEGGPERVALAIGDALGIPIEEDDMTPEQLLDYKIPRSGSVLGGTTSLRAVLANFDRSLELDAARDRALAAAVTALSNNPDVDIDALKVVISDAVKTSTPTAAQTAAALLPLVEDIAERVLAADNQALADEFLRQLRDALPEGN